MKTLIEKKSERKKKAIIKLVETNEYSIAFALLEAERLNDEGKLLDNDYEELAEYLESLLEPVEETVGDDLSSTEDSPSNETQDFETNNFRYY